MLTPEGREKKAIKDYLDEIGAWHRWPVPSGYGKPDIDCHASIFGQFWAIEAKAPGKPLTVPQERTLREAHDSGAQTTWGTAATVIGEIDAWRRRKAFGGPVEHG